MQIERVPGETPLSNASVLEFDGVAYAFVDLKTEAGESLAKLPYIHRILLENVVRLAGKESARAKAAILDWLKTGSSNEEIPFLPGRVLMHDTTCGPALVDIAGMRSALAEAGYDPSVLNPVVPVDVSTDHSLGVDFYAQKQAFQFNIAREYERNAERYQFMKWATNTLSNFRIHPPGTGIMHTLNLERLATIVTTVESRGQLWAAPDTMIGTDSHTPMINGIGVLGWGVGGLEAESVMFGMPVTLRVPDVIGVRLTGKLQSGTLATDLALSITERLRQLDLQDKYVEFFGPGVSTLTAGDRAVVANMTPEFGGNSGYFPIDEQTLVYLKQTGRTEEHVRFVEFYAKHTGIWFDPEGQPTYTNAISIDLAEIEISLAGPTRPQDRIHAASTRSALRRLTTTATNLPGHLPNDGAVAIAAITSCTNTSDPRLVIAAGLLARKARGFGLKPSHWVKTSLAPGSPTAEHYLRRAGLLEDLEAVGFGIVGYGCTTCIGNSGPLPQIIVKAMEERRILPVAVLSGNRNFPGRVHPQLEAGFLASPPMVVAFALAGTVDIDILNDSLGFDANGRAVKLRDLWPTSDEIDHALSKSADKSDVSNAYEVAEASVAWSKLDAPTSVLFPWDEASTYIRRPPFARFAEKQSFEPFEAIPLLVLGNDITTDHISPAGAIPPRSLTGAYLTANGDDPADLNVYASRRGNWEAMVRGLFTNKTVKNRLRPDLLAGTTLHVPSNTVMPLWEAAQAYRDANEAVVIVAGERYGMGSSRDWAAKGAALLSVKAVLALSFERIHRSNLVGMGVLPLRLPFDFGPDELQICPGDTIRIGLNSGDLRPRAAVPIRIRRPDGKALEFEATAAIETDFEVDTLLAGGVLPMILRRMVPDGMAASHK
ncbi:aconitate hydratase AcnA [Agrobacterium rhizogenes]|nr:aconitate hydratase AcnA [Rhizobium rhizogenes]NTJ78287.1 aconitate hydratase AcnA [Rhizobium rhizogenes]